MIAAIWTSFSFFFSQTHAIFPDVQISFFLVFFLRLIMDDDKQALAIGLGAGLGGFAGLVRI